MGITISGFLIPNTGIDAKLGVVAYLGDGQTGGDTLTFNGVALTDGVASTNNFFNASRTWLGAPVSISGDLPQTTGGSRSMSGVDLDVVDVTSLVTPGSTSASAQVKAGGDGDILVGVWVTSVTTYKPNFNESLKAATDENGGALLLGEVLEYRVHVVNTGNDPALGVELRDVLPAGVTFVPGTIQVLTGANTGGKTDVASDDQGEYVAASRTVVIRLGAGANALTGGQMAIGESSDVAFRVLVEASAAGSVLSNQATISARGLNGAPTTTFQSDDGNGGPTTVTVDFCGSPADCPPAKPVCYDPPNPKQPNFCVECLQDSDCSGTKPVCNTASMQCEGCSGDVDCKDPARPVCAASGTQAGACVECAAGSAVLCSGSKPICLEALNLCGCTDTDGDSECGGPTSGVICNGPVGICTPGCSKAAGRNDCPAGQFCSKQDGTVGACWLEPCVDNSDCSPPQVICDTSQLPHACVQCLADTDCASPLVCDAAATHTCVECTSTKTWNCSAADAGAVCLTNLTCGCLADPDCGAQDSGRVCGPASKCAAGCRGTGNGCPSGLVCTSKDSSLGTCVVPDGCQTDADCAAPTPWCDTTTSPKACVACLSDAHCQGVTPVCSASNTCVGCSSDADCHDPLRPACQQAGVLSGACTECSASNAALCGGAKPLCLFDLGVCGCALDSDCGASDSGRVCDASKCEDGCRGQGGNGCPAALLCTSTDNTIGQCVTPVDAGADGGEEAGDAATDGQEGDGEAEGGDAGDSGDGGVDAADAISDSSMDHVGDVHIDHVGDVQIEHVSDGHMPVKDGAGDVKDGGMVVDAHDFPPDGSGATPAPDSLEGGGCGCTAAGSSGRGWTAALVLAGAVMMRRRRQGR